MCGRPLERFTTSMFPASDCSTNKSKNILMIKKNLQVPQGLTQKNEKVKHDFNFYNDWVSNCLNPLSASVALV